MATFNLPLNSRVVVVYVGSLFLWASTLQPLVVVVVRDEA